MFISKLSAILALQSNHINNTAVSSYVISTLKALPGVEYKIQPTGTIYAVKKSAKSSTYPIFLARMSGFGTIYTDYHVERLPKNVWIAYSKKEDGKVEQVQLNAAVKCSVFLALRMLETVDNVGCVFFTDLISEAKEAINIDKDFFKNGRWVCSFDGEHAHKIYNKHGNTPLINSTFKSVLEYRANKFNFEITSTQLPGLDNLLNSAKIRLSMFSLSGGYFLPHSCNEHVSETAIFKTYELAKTMVKDVTGTFAVVEDTPLIPRKYMSYWDGWCSSVKCTKKLTPSEKYFCYSCLTQLRSEGGRCQNCKRTLAQSSEFFENKCTTCLNRK